MKPTIPRHLVEALRDKYEARIADILENANPFEVVLCAYLIDFIDELKAVLEEADKE